jgi:hypothetical protein
MLSENYCSEILDALSLSIIGDLKIMTWVFFLGLVECGETAMLVVDGVVMVMNDVDES